MEKPHILSTNDKDSFAYYTLIERFPCIIDSIIVNNIFDDGINQKLSSLKKMIPYGKLELLETNSEEIGWINNQISENNYSWNNAPFLFLENYLYHKLCEITKYHQTGFDFFAYKKNEDVLKKLSSMIQTLQKVDKLLELPDHESFKEIIYMNLNGNMADLSHLSALKNAGVKLLIDHTQRIKDAIFSAQRIDIILDNSGEELFFDLLLAYWVLKKISINVIHLHFKNIPYFVSDAMISDFFYLMDHLKDSEFGQTISDNLNAGKIILRNDSFWSTGCNFNQLPNDLLEDLNKSDLLIFKGDLNYRKLIEDRHWNYVIPTYNLINYFNTNCLIIRVLKSELIVGLKQEEIPNNKTNEWLYNAEYGIIEYVDK